MSKEDQQPKPFKVTNIALAVAAVMQSINAIPKDRKNEQQGFKFRGIEDCFNTLHPIFAAHGVVCVPFTEKVDFSDGTNAKGTKWFRATVTVVYNFTASDGSVLASKVMGDAFDFGDKALPKAYSMALKTLLTEMFLIPTADIADADRDSFTIDAVAAITRDPYAGKSLAELEALRDELMKAQQVPPADLLGKIAEEKCAKADADAALGPQKQQPAKTAPATPAAPASPAAPAKAAEKAPAAKKAPPVKAPEPTPVAVAEVIPPAPAEDTPFENSDEKPEQANFLDHVITAVKNAKYLGKKVGELDVALLKDAKEKWIDKNKDLIASDPVRKADADAILEAIAYWEKAGVAK